MHPSNFFFFFFLSEKYLSREKINYVEHDD